jgi:hypothetical protein
MPPEKRGVKARMDAPVGEKNDIDGLTFSPKLCKKSIRMNQGKRRSKSLIPAQLVMSPPQNRHEKACHGIFRGTSGSSQKELIMS